MTIHADQAETARTEAFAAIRDGNDRFRKSFGADFTTPGQVLMSAGVDAKDIAFRQAAMCALIAYDGFTPETDAHGAHDFGVLSVAGARVFWKIDLLPVVDAARPGAVRRILTLFLPSEA